MADERRVVTSSMAPPGWGWGVGPTSSRCKKLDCPEFRSGEAVARKLAEAPYNKKSWIDQSHYGESDSRCAGQAVEFSGVP
jgi:hypothetical protein